jgi:hypothetical protein
MSRIPARGRGDLRVRAQELRSHNAESCAVIRLQFVAASGFLSGLIRWFSHGAGGVGISHVDAVLPDGRLLGARFDKADGVRGVAIRRPNYEKWIYRAVIELPCDKGVEEAFYAALESQLGKPYDWRAILAFFFNRDWRARDSWYCSELQAWALEPPQSGFFQHPLALTVNRITPGDLLLLTSAFGSAPNLLTAGATKKKLPSTLP